MTQKWTRSLVAITFLLTVAIADAQTKIKPGFNLFSPEQDVEVGQQSVVEAEQQLPILNDSQVNSYVNQIGQRLAANAGGPGFQYRFRVVNASDINAFALPGGFIYINRGVLDNARIEKEAQLLRVSDRPTENVAQLQAIQSRLGSFGAARTSQQIAQSSASTSSTGSRQRTTSSQPVNVNVPAPSNSLNSYTSRSGVYRVSYPSNWQVYESSSVGVTIAPPGGVGNVDGNSEVIYGALINHYDPFGNQSYGNISLQEATQDLLSEIQRTSPYLRLASNNAQQLRLSGGTALAATLRGTDPMTGVNERVVVVTRQLSDEHLLYLLFITPDREANNYRNVLNAMISSLQINPSQQH